MVLLLIIFALIVSGRPKASMLVLVVEILTPTFKPFCKNNEESFENCPLNMHVQSDRPFFGFRGVRCCVLC